MSGLIAQQWISVDGFLAGAPLLAPGAAPLPLHLTGSDIGPCGVGRLRYAVG
jgi:hypothetical protein